MKKEIRLPVVENINWSHYPSPGIGFLGSLVAEGEIPYEAKTGAGPILLTYSFPYVRDWLNEPLLKMSQMQGFFSADSLWVVMKS